MKRFLLYSLCLVFFSPSLKSRAEDDFSTIQKAITASIQQGPGGVVTLEPGRTYRLGTRPEAVGALTVIGADGLTIDGNGATLLAHPSCMVFAIAKSRNITVKNLEIDYDPLPYTQAVIQSTDPESGTLTFVPMSGYPEPEVSDGYIDTHWSDSMFYDRDSRKIAHVHLRYRTISRNEDGTFTATFHWDPASVSRVLAARKPGDFLTIKLPYYREAQPLRDTDGRLLAAYSAAIRVAYSKDVRVENVTLYAAPRMGFGAVGSEGMVLDHYRVLRKPGTDRLASLCSDGAHFKSVSIMPTLSHCHFEGTMDDAVHVKISSACIVEKQGKKLVIVHNDIAYDDIAMEPGMRVSFYDFAAKRHLGFAVLHSVKPTQYRQAEIELEEDVPEIFPGVLLYTCPETLLEVSDCTFKNSFNNALLVHPSAVIRNTWFEDVNVAIHAITHEIIEGPMPPGLMTVENCDFVRCGDAAIALYVPSPESLPEGSRALKLSQSRFRLSDHNGIAVRSHNQTGIDIEEISIESCDGVEPTAPIQKF